MENFSFEGKDYSCYQDMVDAKRQRNMNMLKNSGLLTLSKHIRSVSESKPLKRGIKSSEKVGKKIKRTLPKRKSSRLAGIDVSDLTEISEPSEKIVSEDYSFFRNRINDGSDLSIKECMDSCGSKWMSKEALQRAKKFAGDFESLNIGDEVQNVKNSFLSQYDSIEVKESYVAKVTPGRIYGITCHPSSDRIVVSAGDKTGFLGIWDASNIDDTEANTESDGVHLFKPHGGAINNLEWNSGGTSLFSFSYDGTVREFDVNKEKFVEVFAAYDDSEQYRGKVGFDVDLGYKFWLQYCCLDPRNHKCMFLSTSLGNVMHMDMRASSKSSVGGFITFNKNLSQNKINSISLHPDENILATAGLDKTIKVWDIRKIGDIKKQPKPISSQGYAKSVTSAFFSPSGKSLLSTTMMDTIDITNGAHLGTETLRSTQTIKHNNQTGRWLSTLMARWHPSLKEDIFVVGSMSQPRRIEVYDGVEARLHKNIFGDGMTSVFSRCCFHPSENELIVVGGNSSGRVAVAKNSSCA